ncbi:MAG TPA: EMC3/TMCO1 family protein [Candidatus Bathyarchaeia archaeon]|nr:EMC3/TMCO1 family protein [Candidatus Bathyarchaeia archaeon]
MVKKERVVQQQKEKMKKLLEGAAMGLGFFILFGILIIPGLREGMGTALGVVLNPFATFVGNFLITILILSVVTGFYTSLIQKYTTNWELMELSKQYQKQIRELQKELMEAKREDNKHRMKKLEKRKAEIMRKQTQFSGEMMRQQMKPMAYIGIITIPIFMWIWEYVEVASVGPAIFPLIGEKAITASFILGLPYWVLWYMVCSIPIAQMIRKAIGIRSAM